MYQFEYVKASSVQDATSQTGEEVAFLGGGQSLLGAMLGAIFVTGMQGALSESETFLETWMLIMGFVFVVVVLFLPKGLAGAVEMVVTRLFRREEEETLADSRLDTAAGGRR